MRRTSVPGKTSQPPEEIKAFTLSDDLLGFRLKRARLDFVREKDVIQRMTLITPDKTIQAVRK